MRTRVAIGAAIRASRGAVPQEDLADSIGARQSEVSHWENGKEAPTFSEIYAIEEALGTSHGTIYAAAGLLEAADVEQAIMADPDLDERTKRWILDAYRMATDQKRLPKRAPRTRSKSDRR